MAVGVTNRSITAQAAYWSCDSQFPMGGCASASNIRRGDLETKSNEINNLTLFAEEPAN